MNIQSYLQANIILRSVYADVYSWVAGDLSWFCHWLSCRDQSVLLILDNLDVEPRRDVVLSAMLDKLVSGCSTLTLLVTSRRTFYRGRFGASHVTYKVPDLRQSADQLFLQVEDVISPALWLNRRSNVIFNYCKVCYFKSCLIVYWHWL